MSKVEIVAPNFIQRSVEKYACDCQKKPFDLRDKEAQIFWQVQVGSQVENQQVICTGEVEKSTVEILAPCAGTIAEILKENGAVFTARDILGTIETV